jgi:hypothetical protein
MGNTAGHRWYKKGDGILGLSASQTAAMIALKIDGWEIPELAEFYGRVSRLVTEEALTKLLGGKSEKELVSLKKKYKVGYMGTAHSPVSKLS